MKGGQKRITYCITYHKPRLADKRSSVHLSGRCCPNPNPNPNPTPTPTPQADCPFTDPSSGAPRELRAEDVPSLDPAAFDAYATQLYGYLQARKPPARRTRHVPRPCRTRPAFDTPSRCTRLHR